MSASSKVKVLKLPIRDAYILEFPRYHDHRGYLEEVYNHESFPPEIARFFPVKQNTLSRSKKHVLRGIHISPYAKLLTCVSGAIYDVVVDVRTDSSTYLRWAAVELTEDNCRQLVVPPNCGHGFYSLSDNSTIFYCQGGCFDKSLKNEKAVSPFDAVINIYWPIPEGVSSIISEKDREAPEMDNSQLCVMPRRMRILIIGASGQVGGVLTEAIQKYSDKYVVTGTYGQNLQEGLVHFNMEAAARDVGECKTLLTMCRPAVICICAAFTWVDGCDKFTEKAKAINVEAVTNLCKCAEEIGAKVVFYSTDYVFDGNGQDGSSKVKPKESTEPRPVNKYGQQKLEAENVVLNVLNTNKQNLVIRTSRIFGPEVQGTNFVYAVVKNIRNRQNVACLKDEVSCPTYNRDLANMTLKLIEAGASGLFHCTGPDCLSKADWGRMICKYFNLDESHIEEVEKCGQAKRPKYVAMDCTKIRNILPNDFNPRNFESAMNHWKTNAFGDKSLFIA